MSFESIARVLSSVRRDALRRREGPSIDSLGVVAVEGHVGGVYGSQRSVIFSKSNVSEPCARTNVPFFCSSASVGARYGACGSGQVPRRSLFQGLGNVLCGS
jgi:hypothetical protein